MLIALGNKLRRRRGTQPAARTRSARPLRVERLEARQCLSTLSIASFGAVANDRVADTAAIAAAVAAAQPGDKVLIPKGVFLLDQTVEIATDAITLAGSGSKSVLRAVAHDFNLFHVKADNVSFVGLNFQGAATKTTTAQAQGRFAIFTDADSPAVGGTVRNSFFTGPNKTTGLNNGIKLDTGSNNWTVTKNTFDRLIGTAAGTGYGILAGASSGHLFQANQFTGAAGQGRHAIYLSGGASDCRVIENVVKKFNHASIAVYSRAYQPVCTSNQIISNKISDQKLGSMGSAGIELDGNVQSTLVQGNVIKRPGRHGIVVAAANEGPLTRDNRLIQNQIYEAGHFGILLDGAIATTVSRNSIFDASVASRGVYSAIHVQADGFAAQPHAADGNVIERNLITSSRGAVHYRWAIILNESPPAPTNSRIQDNLVKPGLRGTIDVADESQGTTVRKGNRRLDSFSRAQLQKTIRAMDLKLSPSQIVSIVKSR